MGVMLKIAIAQIAPILLDRAATLAKMADWVDRAGKESCKLVAFGESLAPAYPVWLCRTDGARFDDPDQKAMHAQYLEQCVVIEDDHLDGLCAAARRRGTTVVAGIAERPADRGGHTIYCSCVVIDAEGRIASVHRKLMPTYEERLAWGCGDGAGLVTHAVGELRLGALNCWENWMPLARAALYAAGENLHVALWPGCERLTRDITRFIAVESRSYVISACGLIRARDLPKQGPLHDHMPTGENVLYDGGSCVAGPDGSWLVAPVVGREELIVAELDHRRVLEERQNFDAAGHYARPDVLKLVVDKQRQATVEQIRTATPGASA
jgi:nitrilase